MRMWRSANTGRLSVASPFRALRSRNYRLFFIGNGISRIGSWMQMVAVGWLAYELTAGLPKGNRAFWLGVVGFAGRIPTFALAPLAGVLVDRWDRRRLVIVTQALAMIQAAILALLTLTNFISLWSLIALALMLGFINTFDVPSRQSFVIELVDRREDLPNAIALNSSLVNGARLIGPAVAGFFLKTVGAGVCFALNALSFLAVLIALFALRIKHPGRREVAGHMLRNLAEGIRYAMGFTPIRDVLVLLALVSLTGASYTVLLPIFAREVLGHGSGVYGLLFAGAGAGALGGAAALAMRRSLDGIWGWISAAPALLGLGLIGLALSRNVVLSVLFMPVIGFAMLVQTASSNTFLQGMVKDHLRGRVMSFYSLAHMGMVPLGSLLAGTLARSLGAPVAVAINGLCCIAGALLFSRRLPVIRRCVDSVLSVERGSAGQ
ncbi:MAG: MFS transporter [Kiritimatiellae bacterium]|nr:MFS transporter [Kiritimatiellia bacterium]